MIMLNVGNPIKMLKNVYIKFTKMSSHKVYPSQKVYPHNCYVSTPFVVGTLLTCKR